MTVLKQGIHCWTSKETAKTAGATVLVVNTMMLVLLYFQNHLPNPLTSMCTSTEDTSASNLFRYNLFRYCKY